MVEQKQINKTIVNGLKQACGCEVIRANQTSTLPKYPFLSFNIITPLKIKGGTYSEYEDMKEKEITQVWSFTVQSDSDMEALALAYTAHEWLEDTGTLQLSESGIVARKISDISNRDNLVSVDYEYRKGFDATFALLSRIDISKQENIVEHINISHETEEQNV